MLVEYSFSDYMKLISKRRKYFVIIISTSVIIASSMSFAFPEIYKAELKMFAPTSIDVMSFVGRGGGGVQLRPLMPNLNELYSGAVMGFLKSERMHDMVKLSLGEEKPRKVNFIIDFQTDYGHFTVKVLDRDGERAARIANIIPEVANELIVEVSESSLLRNIEYIKTQMDTAKKELEEARAVIRDFQEKNIHVVLPPQSQMLINKNAEYQYEYDRLGLEMDRIQAEYSALKSEMEKESQLFVEEESISQDMTIQQLRNSLTEREMRMANMRAQFTEFHPSVIALEKEIEQIKELLHQEVERLYSSETKPSSSFYESLRQTAVRNLVELTSTQARRDALERLIEKSNNILLSFPSIQNEMANLMFDEKVKETVVEGLVGRLTELRLQVGRQFQTFIVLEEAEIPKSPSFPLLSLNILLAILFGFAGGFIYCVLLEYYEKAELMRYADTESSES